MDCPTAGKVWPKARPAANTKRDVIFINLVLLVDAGSPSITQMPEKKFCTRWLLVE
jgi:hypothetical protein